MEEKLQRLFVVTGPESSGKSTLAAALAQWLDAPLVAEAARDYLQDRMRASMAGGGPGEVSRGAPDYDAQDVIEIAQLQQRAENTALEGGSPLVIADTDRQVLELWWRERFSASAGPYPVKTSDRAGVQRHYLLCYPDLVWQPDPLRENPFDRERLFKQQMQRLDEIGARYRVIWGQGAFRLRLARSYLKASLAGSL